MVLQLLFRNLPAVPTSLVQSGGGTSQMQHGFIRHLCSPIAEGLNTLSEQLLPLIHSKVLFLYPYLCHLMDLWTDCLQGMTLEHKF